ncbi:MAG: hypothetical protein ACRD15_04500, partial [Vicinamibacterales bacterium]
SGYTPASFRKLAPVFWSFPDESAINAMREAGVTHVTVHPRLAERAAHINAVLSRRPDFQLLATAQGIRLYRLR